MCGACLRVSLSSLCVVALLLPAACSGDGPAGDDRLFVPEDLPNTPRDGEVGVTLKLVASTLVQGRAGPELYAAVRNDGDTPTCNAGIMIDFIDEAGQIVTTAGGPLQSNQLYRLDPDVILNCIDPGQIAMAASNIPSEVVIGELGSLRHSFPTFGGFDGIVPTAGYGVSQVETVASGAGGTYKGTFTNGMDFAVTGPSVTIFPVNRVGRPLSVATSSATVDIPPGGTWSFETTTVNDLGADYAAYATASRLN